MSRQFCMSLTATEILVWPNRRSTGIDAFTLTDSTKLHQQQASVAAMMKTTSPPDDDDDVMGD